MCPERLSATLLVVKDKMNTRTLPVCVTRFAREELESSVGIGDATAERIKVQTAKSIMNREDIFETDGESG